MYIHTHKVYVYTHTYMWSNKIFFKNLMGQAQSQNKQIKLLLLTRSEDNLQLNADIYIQQNIQPSRKLNESIKLTHKNKHKY